MVIFTEGLRFEIKLVLMIVMIEKLDNSSRDVERNCKAHSFDKSDILIKSRLKFSEPFCKNYDEIEV